MQSSRRGWRSPRRGPSTVPRVRDYAVRLRASADRLGLRPLLFDSGGRGFHLWLLLAPRRPARAARLLLDIVAEGAGQPPELVTVETFPKQVGWWTALSRAAHCRRRRPAPSCSPPDPVNALLSLGYTLLLRRIESAAAVVGLDPFLGALHAPEAGRPGLALDLMEPFRAPLVDALVVAAINKGAIRAEHFERLDQESTVAIASEGLRAFVALFSRRLERAIVHPSSGTRMPYRDAIIEECRGWARFVLGRPELVCFAPR